MKRRRALVPELNEIRPELSIKEQVAMAVSAIHEKDPAGDKVFESAVDVLVQAMKRRTSTVEL
jgi:ABC-type branched-subunit amino acid transport system ATPase component